MKLKTIKRTSLGVTVFLIAYLCYALIFNLGPTVGMILSLVLKPTFKLENISFPEKGVIIGEGVSVYYKGTKMVEAPRVRIEYKLEGKIRDWLRDISVYKPNFIIERKNEFINITNAFSTGGKNKTGTGVPIRLIRVIDGVGIFSEQSHEHPIIKEFTNVNGYVSFDRIMGIDLLFTGRHNGTDEVSYSFTNYYEDFSMRIKGKNIPLETKILQYAYYRKGIEYFDGLGDIDLTIADSGLFGYANISGLGVKYSDFLEKGKNFNGKVKFEKDTISLNGNFELFNKKRDLTLNFNHNSGLYIDVNIGELTWNEVSNYRLLNSLDLDLDLKLNDIRITMQTDENVNFYFDINSKIRDFNMSGVEFKNINPKISYRSATDKVKIELDYGKIEFLEIEKKIGIGVEFLESNGKVNYEIGSLKGEGEFSLNDEDVSFKLINGILKGNGNYTYDTRKLELYNLLNARDRFKVLYDFNDMNLERFIGTINYNLIKGIRGKIQGDIENNKGKIQKLTIVQDKDKDKEILTSELTLNLRDDKKKIDFKTILNFKNDAEEDEIKGEIEGESEFLNGKAKLLVDSKFEKIKYSGISFKNIVAKLNLEDNVIKIENISNDILQLKGDIDLNKEELKLSYSINEMTNEEIGVTRLNFREFNINGKVKGKFHEPIIDFNIVQGNIYPREDEPIMVRGNGELKNGVLSVKKLQIGERNTLNGMYTIGNKEYSIKGNISMDNLHLYLDSSGFEYIIDGDINIKGKGSKVQSDSRFNISGIRHHGTHLDQSLSGVIRYNADNLSDGVITVEQLNVLNRGNRVGTFRGDMNLENRTLNLNLNERAIQMSNLLGVNNSLKLKGISSLLVNITGDFDSPQYRIELLSRELSINNVKLTDFRKRITGIGSRINLEELRFLLYRNQVLSTGFYDLGTGEHRINISANDINLDFVNELFKTENLGSIRGQGEVNVVLSNQGNRGIINGKNIHLKERTRGNAIDNMNFSINLNGSRVNIEHLEGNVNDGKLGLSGYFVIPELNKILNGEISQETLDFNLNLKTEGVRYIIPRQIDMVVNSSLVIAPDSLRGYVKIENGEVRRIPGISDGPNILRFIRDNVFRRGSSGRIQESSNDSSFLGNGIINRNLEVDVEFGIVNSIKLDIQSVFGIIEDLRGNLEGGGHFRGKNGRIGFQGGFDWKRGNFVLNNIDFVVREANLIFRNENSILPNLNPNIRFEAFAQDVFNFYEIGLGGQLSDMTFRFRRNREVVSGRVAYLFESSNGGSSDLEETQRFIINSVLNNQINTIFLRPISTRLKNFLRLSHLRVISNIEDLNNDGPGGREDRGGDRGYSVGIRVQAKKRIMDNLFLVAEAGVSDETNRGNNSSTGNPGTVNRYRLGVDYMVGNSGIIGVGVSKTTTESSVSTSYGSNSENYYINYIFHRRGDSIGGIFTDIVDKLKYKKAEDNK